MKKITTTLLLAYYAFGTLFLPLGDFAALKDLCTMYRHCKATEDKDMTVVDFFTDHLINIDGIFDKHENGDPQKPHQSQPTHHQQVRITYTVASSDYIFPGYLIREKPSAIYQHTFYRSLYSSGIFRPPIA